MILQNPSQLLREGPTELLDRSLFDYARALHGLEGLEDNHLEAVDYVVRHQTVRLLVKRASEDELAEAYDSIKSLVPVERERDWSRWHQRWNGIADVLDARLASLAAREPNTARGLAHADRILDLVRVRPDLSQNQIAEYLDLKPANLSRILGVLEAHELIERRTVGREKQVRLGFLADHTLTVNESQAPEVDNVPANVQPMKNYLMLAA